MRDTMTRFIKAAWGRVHRRPPLPRPVYYCITSVSAAAKEKSPKTVITVPVIPGAEGYNVYRGGDA